MASRGLTQAEHDHLAAAGFTPGLIAAVEREVLTPSRKQFERRRLLLGGLVYLALGALAFMAVWQGRQLFILISYALLAVAAPLRIWIDLREAAINRAEPAGHAARRLVWLAREVRAARTVNSLAAQVLRGHAEAVGETGDPPTALGEIARRITPGDHRRLRAEIRVTAVTGAGFALLCVLMIAFRLF
jgi:hypothetical protein